MRRALIDAPVLLVVYPTLPVTEGLAVASCGFADDHEALEELEECRGLPAWSNTARSPTAGRTLRREPPGGSWPLISAE